MEPHHPKNVQALRAWLEEHRPDMIASFDVIISANEPRSVGEEVLTLMLMGFEAGRKYQAENPDSDPEDHDYL